MASVDFSLFSLFGSRNDNWMDAEDLTSFITRPELKVPRLILRKLHPDLIGPVYICMAPYINTDAEPYIAFYRPCQVGSKIYDLDGELARSGACIFSNWNAYDFKLVRNEANQTMDIMSCHPVWFHRP